MAPRKGSGARNQRPHSVRVAEARLEAANEAANEHARVTPAGAAGPTTTTPRPIRPDCLVCCDGSWECAVTVVVQ